MELTVFCDIPIFELLLRHAKATWKGSATPAITHENVMPLLISSDFLQMNDLARECTEYIASSFSDLMIRGFELSSITEPLLERVVTVQSVSSSSSLYIYCDIFRMNSQRSSCNHVEHMSSYVCQAAQLTGSANSSFAYQAIVQWSLVILTPGI
jgi:hypothetical protein